jgi:hypothetical protein
LRNPEKLKQASLPGLIGWRRPQVRLMSRFATAWRRQYGRIMVTVGKKA